MEKKKKLIAVVLAGLVATIILSSTISILIYDGFNKEKEKAWTTDYFIENLDFSSTGNNTYFILEPGFRLILEGVEDGKDVQLNITVLNETINIGGIETRIIEESETEDGELIEISRNYFAICTQTQDMFYFGEVVDLYENGVIVGHEGQWKADEGDNKAGIIMPGSPLIGARYYQEIAEDVAMDRAEVIDNNVEVVTPIGTFHNCLKTKESTPLEPSATEYKYYAVGIGLVQEESLKLTWYGFVEV